MAFDIKVKLKVKGRGTGYRPKTTSARLPKWSPMKASLPEQLTQPRPLTCHLISKVKFNVEWRGRYWILSRNYAITCQMQCTCQGQMQDQRFWFISCSGRLAILWHYFGTPADVISGRYPVHHPLTWGLEGRMQGKGHGFASCSGRLAIVWDHFGTRVDVISGRHPVTCP